MRCCQWAEGTVAPRHVKGRFTHAFATSASCSPSRSVLLTGMHNHANGMYGLQHDMHHFSSFENVKSLPVLLRQAGYLTARVGKFHLAPETVYEFERVLSAGQANDNASIGRSPVQMADLCKGVMQQKGRPFFLYFATDDPHRNLPFQSYPQPNTFGNRLEPYPGTIDVKYSADSVIVPDFLPDIPETRAELAQYYQAVSRLDQGVGRLLQLLKETGQYEKTIIVYLSDNGIAFQGAKTTVYDAGLRLPLIVRVPSSAPYGKSTDAMVSWTDIAPTLLQWAGVPTAAKHMHGSSFAALFEKAGNYVCDTVYASHSFHEIDMYYPMRAIRTRNFKLIWNIAHPLEFPAASDLYYSSSWQGFVKRGGTFHGKRTAGQLLHRPAFELYDLQQDPDEVRNLADNPAYAEIKSALIGRLRAFLQRTNDPWMRKQVHE